MHLHTVAEKFASEVSPGEIDSVALMACFLIGPVVLEAQLMFSHTTFVTILDFLSSETLH